MGSCYSGNIQTYQNQSKNGQPNELNPLESQMEVVVTGQIITWEGNEIHFTNFTNPLRNKTKAILPPEVEVQKEHQNVSQAMKSVLTSKNVTFAEKIFTQKEIQKFKALNDIRAVAVEHIEKELSKCGIDFALTPDSSQSNLALLPFFASSTVQNSTCFQIKLFSRS